jgi:hypothetical protein
VKHHKYPHPSSSTDKQYPLFCTLLSCTTLKTKAVKFLCTVSNNTPIYTASHPAKTAILRPDILLVTLGNDRSSAIITILFPSLKLKHIFKNFLIWVIKKCACDVKYGSHQHLKAFIWLLCTVVSVNAIHKYRGNEEWNTYKHTTI